MGVNEVGELFFFLGQSGEELAVGSGDRGEGAPFVELVGGARSDEGEGEGGGE